MIADFYKILIDNDKKLMSNLFTFLTKKICSSLSKLANLFKVGIKTKKYTACYNSTNHNGLKDLANSTHKK